MSTETVQIVIDSLRAAGVKYVFGVPGAKIDSVFNALVDHPEIKLVVTRHEQNAAFIAAAIGKLTGTPGVCIATSGPGTSNLVTGLITATDEGCPMVAIVGSVKRSQALMRTHQSLKAVELLSPVTKRTSAAVVPDQVAEIMLNAFRVATSYPQGATAVSLPIDVMTSGMTSTIPAFSASAFLSPDYGPAPQSAIEAAVHLIETAKFPVLYLGARAAESAVIAAVHAILKKHPIPVVETFQAAGAISRELVHLFFGRIGLFRNQPGDKLLSHADLVIAIGYDQAEYDASTWNANNRFDILHIDYHAADVGYHYNPRLELIGSIEDNLSALASSLTKVARPQDSTTVQDLAAEFHSWQTSPRASISQAPGPVHPLYFIRLLQSFIQDNTTVISDVGSVYIWLSRYFYSYAPKTFLVSNVQQTLGVALPWAIGASLCQEVPCRRKVVSISGDGGFLFSAQELVTAVQQGCDITHFIWNDGKYNMVEFQEIDRYGRSAGVDLGGVDFVKYAEAFGARGLRVETADQLEEVMKESLEWRGVVVVDVVIDYSENHALMENVVADNVS